MADAVEMPASAIHRNAINDTAVFIAHPASFRYPRSRAHPAILVAKKA